ncbi:class I SAM-dependent methyltransferase [Conexibacter sp. SYSU D00693]|uniref:class I SAM-dependent methyltransferase n=1 Tax=Conexibacter sp. SYSU D00693 TaxID=2812560 RepID=UPI00196B1394|nr:methyltransferase domain-containing protein [Conexibacter sp. SYSU D00693]
MDLREQIAQHPGWYHTIELAPGVETPGSCDLRPLAPGALPQDLAGKRCLDVGTFDGFWAFEMERRGGEVIALDLDDIRQADFPPNARAEIEAGYDPSLPWGSGFRIAHEALGSTVRRVTGNVYDLSRELIGVDGVDVVLCGTILQHLRDPVKALENMRGVLRRGGVVLMVESYSAPLSRRHPRRPVSEFRPATPGSIYTWWVPNLAGLNAWALAAGLEPTGAPAVRHKPIRGAGPGDRIAALTLRPKPLG